MRISTGSFQTGMEDILATFTNIIIIIIAGSFESSMKHILSLPQNFVFLKQTIFGIWDLPKTNQRMLAKYDCSQMVI